jgi:NAD(P)-dependent dehydrogenase (short-subunit alcohol dehydrogenase family)
MRSPARIVNSASAAHQGARLDFDDLQLAKSFGPMKAYGRSKLCNILFTRELARHLQGMGVTANCLHPGFVATRFGDQSGGVISHFVGLAKLFAISPEMGADTISRLLARRRGNDGRIFLQAPTHRTIANSARRQSCSVTLGAQRCLKFACFPTHDTIVRVVAII